MPRIDYDMRPPYCQAWDALFFTADPRPVAKLGGGTNSRKTPPLYSARDGVLMDFCFLKYFFFIAKIRAILEFWVRNY